MYTIQDLKYYLSKINDKRSIDGNRIILKKDWSAFLSTNGHQIKKYWIDEIVKGNGIAQEKAQSLLSAINSQLKAHDLETIDPAKAIVGTD
jgi:hypothetical protein